jgi:hypothetical protein
MAYVDELLQVLVEVGQIVFTLLVLGNELLFPLGQLQPLLLEGLALRAFVGDTGDHQSVLIVVGVVWELGDELLDGDERQLEVRVTKAVSEGARNAAKGLTRRSRRR